MTETLKSDPVLQLGGLHNYGAVIYNNTHVAANFMQIPDDRRLMQFERLYFLLVCDSGKSLDSSQVFRLKSFVRKRTAKPFFLSLSPQQCSVVYDSSSHPDSALLWPSSDMCGTFLEW